jgi:predicted metal-dependent phosphoesterase TrpH
MWCMAGKVDLHLHTTYSDGAHTAEEVVALARRAGLSALSITDHDNVGAIDDALTAGRRWGVGIIPGVELSTTVDEQDIHILGYFVDHHHPTLQEFLALFRAERLKRAERIVEKLRRIQVPLDLESVLRQAGTGSVGRPHIANALLQTGHTDTYHEAFAKYIGDGKPAFEKKYRISPREAFEVIAEAGGLSFIAHPGNTVPEHVLLELIHEGVDGIEAIHPSHSPDRVHYYQSIANEYFLLVSGGSDFHGGNRNDRDAIGRFVVTDEHIAAMHRRLRS